MAAFIAIEHSFYSDNSHRTSVLTRFINVDHISKFYDDQFELGVRIKVEHQVYFWKGISAEEFAEILNKLGHLRGP